MEIYNAHNIYVDVQSLGALGTNVGTVVNGNRGIIIDAPFGTAQNIFDMATMKHFQIQYLLLTHNHWDHFGDASQFSDQNIPIFAHECDQPLMEHPEDYDTLYETFMQSDIHIKACHIDRILTDGDRFEICDLEVIELWIPGHTTGGAAYYFKNLGICFTGDTLFSRTVGRSDFPGGDKHALFKSIRDKLYILPDETIVVPGHGRLTTIGKEKRENPYVRPK